MGKIEFEDADALTDGDAVFETKRARLAEQAGSGSNQLITNAMQRPHVHLLWGLDLDEPLCRSRRSCSILHTA
ncbi:hypothetical protein [Methylocapsa acidiphila]|uniref:hypothetical protein n=1 Tax=Methylocapsa acidiphila TaxID=133552 RepID=UPI0012EC8525|nr:hypothetical protein [Methylocapsa acidiphila]